MSLTRDRVAANVRAELARAQLRRADVANRLGLSYGALCRRLNGGVAFDVDEIAALANLLEVPASQLLDEAAA